MILAEILKNILIESERYSLILKEINTRYGEEMKNQYRDLLENIFLRIAYISGIADSKFVSEEKIAILFYFFRIFEEETEARDLQKKLFSDIRSEEDFTPMLPEYKKRAEDFYKERLVGIEEEFTKEDREFEKITPLLEEMIKYDRMTGRVYYYRVAAIAYRFASFIMKADGIIVKSEVKTLRNLWLFLYSPRDRDEKPHITHSTIRKELDKLEESTDSLDSCMRELEELIGLRKVKEEIESLVNFIKVRKMREKKRLSCSDLNLHMVFQGNPGTGKTIVARITAKIFKSLGILEKGHLTETDRAGLVADFIGQTATKTDKVITEALDGVLFIDEAYALSPPNNLENDFGPEAISTLLKRMEDYRERLVVIVAGYPKETEAFLKSNPGFQSRFNTYIHFPDYSPGEMREIFYYFCKKRDYEISRGAIKKLEQILENEYKNRDKFFGNARLVRNIFERAMRNQANRVAEISPITRSILITIEAEDLDFRTGNSL